eukprot:6353423-Amphidinium_carterae.1
MSACRDFENFKQCTSELDSRRNDPHGAFSVPLYNLTAEMLTQARGTECHYALARKWRVTFCESQVEERPVSEQKMGW